MDLSPLLNYADDLGAACGIAGAWLVGSRGNRGRYWGFFGFFVSNLLLIAWALWFQHWSILVMQGFFVVTSVRGLWTNRVGA
jgi:hypothetical protein